MPLMFAMTFRLILNEYDLDWSWIDSAKITHPPASIFQAHVSAFEKLPAHYSKLTWNMGLQNDIITQVPNASLPLMDVDSLEEMISVQYLQEHGINVVHRNKFFLCRVAVPAMRMNALHVVVADPSGSCMRLALFNYIHFETAAWLNYQPYVIPVGTILAIMHPWFKQARGGGFVLRCDNPTHVKALREDDPILDDVVWAGAILSDDLLFKSELPDDDLEAGDFYAARDNNPNAIDRYNKALQLKPNDPNILTRRADALLSLELFEEVLEDVKLGLSLDSRNIKLLYLKGAALARSGKCEQALKHIQTALKQHVNDDDLLMLKTQVECLKQEQNGSFDLPQLQMDALAGVAAELHSDFVSPSIGVCQVGNKGRGVVANVALSAGTTVMMCKPVAFVKGNSSQQSMSEDMWPVIRSMLINDCCQKLLHNVKLRRQFYELYAGDESKLQLDPVNNELLPLDVNRIAAIVDINTIRIDCPRHGWKGSGVWLMPSYMNNSCIDNNCVAKLVGPLLMVRTVKEISKDNELLISYRGVIPYIDRNAYLLGQLGFLCDCRLCKAERKDYSLASIEFRQVTNGYLPWLRNNASESELNELLNRISPLCQHRDTNIAVNLLREALALKVMVRDNRTKVFERSINKCIQFWLDMNQFDIALLLIARIMDTLTSINQNIAKRWKDQYNSLAELTYGHVQLCDMSSSYSK